MAHIYHGIESQVNNSYFHGRYENLIFFSAWILKVYWNFLRCISSSGSISMILLDIKKIA